ncbi:MAG: CBASS cGAMP-activated phospholipase [Bdellovibrionales bacterium]|nr:CBASS cGAMP-activated phospholipase [Bdellovibrionales bacterium]
MKDSGSYKVLSLDGGGMRGLYTASVLKTLVSCFSDPSDRGIDKDIGKGFDLIVGTSTGGILACGLAAGVSINKIIELYSKKGQKIFTYPFPSKEVKEQLLWGFKNRDKAANSQEILMQELRHIFGTKTMGQIYQERQMAFCITAVDLINSYPKIFKTPHNSYKEDEDRLLVDLCLATSAAPVLFPIAFIPSPKKDNVYEEFVDGALWANSPILVALTEAIAVSQKDQPVEIVSVGTCPPPIGKVISHKKKASGLLKWRFGMDLMELTTSSQSQAHHVIADTLCAQFQCLGKEVVVHRLKQSVPPLEQAELLSLDQPGGKACSLLMNLGKKDGEDIYKTDKHNILKTIFTHLPDIENKG